MKYFSPAILDGSVTTAKLASSAVTRAKIKDGISSQSGSIPTQGKVTVSLDAWAFFPELEADMPVSATLDVQVLPKFKAVPAGSVNFPEFDLRNEDTGSARNYDVDWRFIDA